MMESSGPYVHREDYHERERDHRGEFDQLWKAVREDIPGLIHESEGRIVERIDKMDTRINGRIRRNSEGIAQLNERVWLSEMFIKLSRHPLIVSFISVGLGALATYFATH